MKTQDQDIPHRVPPLLEQARDAWRSGRYDRALQGFRHAAENGEPGAAGACARALVSLGQLDQAITLLDSMPADADAALLRILFFIEQRPIAQNHRLLNQYCRQHGPHPLAVVAAELLEILHRGRAPPPAADARHAALQSSAAWLSSRGGADLAFGTPAALLATAVSAAPQDGLCLEFGVYFGRSIRQIAGHRPGIVHGFDSFQGLPEDWKAGEPAGAYSTGGELPEVPDQVVLHQGWFADTVPAFMERHPDPLAFAHIDCDLYSSTRTVLDALAPRLHPGSVLLFDDLLGFPDYPQHEFRALGEAAAEYGWRWELLGFVFLGREVAIRIRDTAAD